MQVIEFSDERSWIGAALAELGAAVAAARKDGRPRLALCLAGGSTPEAVYRAMAALPMAGLALDLWLGDERVVPAGDARRNGSMIARAFAACSWTPPPRLRLWPEAQVEAEALEASALYEAELRASLGPAAIFDLAFQGLGADGHTASVFPGAEAGSPLLAGPRLALPSRSPVPPHSRMTLTLGAIKAARRRVFLVRGEDKLPALRKLEAEDPSIPASQLAGPGALVLFLR
jgi:6-phosphogluconolactonase